MRYLAALGVSVAVAAVEIYGGIRGQSIGLIADAMHAGTDSLAIGIMILAQRHNIELRGAIVNGVLLLLVTTAIAFASVERLMHPLHPQGLSMASISALALLGNFTAGCLLLHGAPASLVTRSALLHVAGDAMGSFAVLVAGLLIIWVHRPWLDPAFSLVVCAIVVAGIFLLLGEVRAIRRKPGAPAQSS